MSDPCVMLSKAANTASDYGSAIGQSVSRATGAVGEMLSSLWLYIMEVAIIFTDPCTLIVFGFAVLVYILVSLLSMGARKAFNLVRPSNQQGEEGGGGKNPTLSVTDVGNTSGNEESDVEGGAPDAPPRDAAVGPGYRGGGYKGLNCLCSQAQFPEGEDFDELAYDKARQGSVVARMIRWANIAFAGQLIDNACSTATCESYSPRDSPYGHGQGVPGRRTSRTDYYASQGGVPNGRKSCRHQSTGGSPVFRAGDHGERRESGYHSHRHRHRHCSQGAPHRHRSPSDPQSNGAVTPTEDEQEMPPHPQHPDLMGAAPPSAPQPRSPPPALTSKPSSWFKSWFKAPKKDVHSAPPSEPPSPNRPPTPPAEDPTCAKPKCQCMCKRTSNGAGGGGGGGVKSPPGRGQRGASEPHITSPRKHSEPSRRVASKSAANNLHMGLPAQGQLNSASPRGSRDRGSRGTHPGGHQHPHPHQADYNSNDQSSARASGHSTNRQSANPNPRNNSATRPAQSRLPAEPKTSGAGTYGSMSYQSTGNKMRPGPSASGASGSVSRNQGSVGGPVEKTSMVTSAGARPTAASYRTTEHDSDTE